MYDKDKLKKDIGLIQAIQWKSVEKDNMEFESRITCYQLDAIRRLVGFGNTLLV